MCRTAIMRTIGEMSSFEVASVRLLNMLRPKPGRYTQSNTTRGM